MAYGLQVFNSAGVITFDSNNVIGAVCLGLYDVPVGGAIYTFPDFPLAQGRFLFLSGGGLSYSVDNAPGYLRFIFDATVPYSVVLFAF